MDRTAIRAARMMTGQAGMLRRQMQSAQTRPRAQGMLFRRTVRVPRGAGLEQVLEKWNPGIGGETLSDLTTSVREWNSLGDGDEVRPGQQLLIPSVIPPGHSPFGGPAGAPVGPGGAPQLARSNQIAISSGLVESRVRSARQGSWVMASQTGGHHLAGANVKQQFQAGGLWGRS